MNSSISRAVAASPSGFAALLAIELPAVLSFLLAPPSTPPNGALNAHYARRHLPQGLWRQPQRPWRAPPEIHSVMSIKVQ
jgi:hypothetical protein